MNADCVLDLRPAPCCHAPETAHESALPRGCGEIVDLQKLRCRFHTVSLKAGSIGGYGVSLPGVQTPMDLDGLGD
jgi:hypothetical protein